MHNSDSYDLTVRLPGKMDVLTGDVMIQMK